MGREEESRVLAKFLFTYYNCWCLNIEEIFAMNSLFNTFQLPLNRYNYLNYAIAFFQPYNFFLYAIITNYLTSVIMLEGKVIEKLQRKAVLKNWYWALLSMRGKACCHLGLASLTCSAFVSHVSLLKTAFWWFILLFYLLWSFAWW